MQTKEEILEIRKKAQMIEDQINSMIQSKEPLEMICERLEKKDASDLSVSDQRIYILCILGTIQRFELQSKSEKKLFENRTTSQLIDLYKKTVLYLRRIEFGLDKELQYELVPYVVQEKISLFAVRGIIMGAIIIRRKDEVWNKVVELFKHKGE